MTRRAELFEEIKAMSARGMSMREIASELNISLTYAYDVRSDPDGSRARERRDRHIARNTGNCDGCGQRVWITRFQQLGQMLCISCRRAARREQRKAEISRSLAEWVEVHGQPPTVVEWSPHPSRLSGLSQERQEEIKARHVGCRWPDASEIIAIYGSWNEFLAAHGYQARPANGSVRANGSAPLGAGVRR